MLSVAQELAQAWEPTVLPPSDSEAAFDSRSAVDAAIAGFVRMHSKVRPQNVHYEATIPTQLCRGTALLPILG